MSLNRVIAPSEEPVTVAEIKQWTRIDANAEDTLLSGIMIPACRGAAEEYTDRALVTQTWELTLDAFPTYDGAVIELRRPPVQSITYVKYLDTNGVEQTLDSSKYRLDAVSAPGRLVPAINTSWPETANTINAVKVRFVCGYGLAALVPAEFKQWIALHVANMYANREAANVGNIVNEMPYVMSLIDPFKVY